MIADPVRHSNIEELQDEKLPITEERTDDITILLDCSRDVDTRIRCSNKS